MNTTTTTNEEYDEWRLSSDPEQRELEIKELLMEELEYCEPSDQFARLLYGTDYEFGLLFVAEEMPDGWYPEHMVDCPEDMRKGWTSNYELCVAKHPDKGVILLGTAYGRVSRANVCACIDKGAKEVSHILALIREDLDLGGEELPVAIVVHGLKREALPALNELAPETLILEDELLDLPRRLEEILDFHREHYPDAHQGPDILDQLKEVGHWMSSESMLETYIEDWS